MVGLLINGAADSYHIIARFSLLGEIVINVLRWTCSIAVGPNLYHIQLYLTKPILFIVLLLGIAHFAMNVSLYILRIMTPGML